MSWSRKVKAYSNNDVLNMCARSFSLLGAAPRFRFRKHNFERAEEQTSEIWAVHVKLFKASLRYYDV